MPRGKAGEEVLSLSARVAGGVLATAGEVEELAEGTCAVVEGRPPTSPELLPGLEEGSPAVFSLLALSLSRLPPVPDSFFTDRSNGSPLAGAGAQAEMGPEDKGAGKGGENEVSGGVLAASTRGREEGPQH